MIKFEKVFKQLGSFCLKDITIELPKGYIMGLIGENGSGKTSLFNLILGLYEPDSGTIRISGREYENCEREIREEIGYVLVDDDLFLPRTKVIHNAEIFGRYYKNYNEKIFIDHCAQFSLDIQKKWRHLSKGEKLKVQFAFALAHESRLLVLDEPTANFDPEFQELFLRIVTSFVSDGEHSVILATHQTQELDRIADYITFLHKGRLLFSKEKETLLETFRLVEGEEYKINLLKQERIIYKETGEYGTSALIRHRKIDTYDEQLAVSIPTLEDIMYYIIKSGRSDRFGGGL